MLASPDFTSASNRGSEVIFNGFGRRARSSALD
jgi:hypothetical protein